MKPKITLFHCINTLSDGGNISAAMKKDVELKVVKLACSSMVKDIYLLRALEAGSDAVIVLVCDESTCRYTEGSIRARKRVGFVKNLIEEIGINGNRLSIFNISGGDKEAAAQIIDDKLSELLTFEASQTLME